MNCSARLWQGVATILSVNGIDVCQGELRGASVDECVDHLLARLPNRFALAGLSLGGVVAMALIRSAPERVRGLALLSTNPRPPTAAQLRSWGRDRAALRSGTSAREVQAGLLPVLLSDQAQSGPLAAEVLAMADDVGPQRLADQLSVQASRIDERPGLARVGVPTLVVAGGADRMCPPDWHQEVHHVVSQSHRVVLEGVGHLSPLEAPAQVALHLADWLDRLCAGQPQFAEDVHQHSGEVVGDQLRATHHGLPGRSA